MQNSLSYGLYMRAIISTYKQRYEIAYLDIEQAIERCDDNIPLYFYAKAMILALNSDYQAAITEFGVTISLNSKYADAFLQRSKCNYIQGLKTYALDDMEKYVNLQENEQE